MKIEPMRLTPTTGTCIAICLSLAITTVLAMEYFTRSSFSHSACSVMLFLDKLVLFFPVGAVDVRALQATALFTRIACLRLLKDSAIASPVVFEIESPFRRVQLFLLARWRLPTTTHLSHTEVSAFP